MLMGSNIRIHEARNCRAQDDDKLPEYVEFTFVIYIYLAFRQNALLKFKDFAFSIASTHITKPRLLCSSLCIFFIPDCPYALLHSASSNPLVLMHLFVNLW